MSKFFELIKALVPSFKSRKVIDDEYLAQSISIYDLERRMREIDSRRWNENRGLAYGLKAL